MIGTSSKFRSANGFISKAGGIGRTCSPGQGSLHNIGPKHNISLAQEISARFFHQVSILTCSETHAAEAENFLPTHLQHLYAPPNGFGTPKDIKASNNGYFDADPKQPMVTEKHHTIDHNVVDFCAGVKCKTNSPVKAVNHSFL